MFVGHLATKHNFKAACPHMLFGKIDPVLAKLRGIEGERYLPMRAGLVYVLSIVGVETSVEAFHSGGGAFLLADCLAMTSVMPNTQNALIAFTSGGEG